MRNKQSAAVLKVEQERASERVADTSRVLQRGIISPKRREELEAQLAEERAHLERVSGDAALAAWREDYDHRIPAEAWAPAKAAGPRFPGMNKHIVNLHENRRTR